MLIRENSILRNLPKEIELKQLLIFDSIRFILETIEYSFSKLNSELEYISKQSEGALNRIPAFHYCWSLINDSSIFFRLYKKIPSLSNHEIIKDVEIMVAPLRNTIQHIDERIDEFIFENKEPFFGSLNWVFKNSSENKLVNIIMISGLYFKKYSSEIKFTTIEYSENLKVVQNIMLATVNKKKEVVDFDISDLYNSLRNIVGNLESSLEIIVEENNLTPKNWVHDRDVVIRLANDPNK